MNAVYGTVLYFSLCVAFVLATNDKTPDELPNTKELTINNALDPINVLDPSTTPVSTVRVTTEIPSTTPQPPLEEGSWVVKNGSQVCIRAKLKIQFTVDIEGNERDINLSSKANATGDCNASNATQVLELMYDNYALTFEFERNSTNAYVKNITFDLTTSEGTDTYYNDTQLFTVSYGNSYLCKSKDVVNMQNVTMQIFDIRLQAFGTADDKGFGTAEECEADDSISDIVPIAVACALAALIVVVLIAYLVGRRRNRQKDYTSM